MSPAIKSYALLFLCGIYSLIMLEACGSGPESPQPTTTVDISAIYWSAVRNPETFDTYLATQNIEARASDCFLRHSNNYFNAEQAKLDECYQMVSYSPMWNACHDEADNLRNGGVIRRDISRAMANILKLKEWEDIPTGDLYECKTYDDLTSSVIIKTPYLTEKTIQYMISLIKTGLENDS